MPDTVIKVDHIARTIQALFIPGQVMEVRVLGGRAPAVGYFDNPESLIAAASGYSSGYEGMYITLNEIEPALLARSTNRFGSKLAASDADVLSRRWLLLDFDPHRPAGISSNDAELDEALKAADATQAYLTSLDWPEPVRALSGNGYHLLYAIELSAQDGGLIERVLRGLNVYTSTITEAVNLDTKVYNPARITKLYGTMAKKGENTPDRPHRQSMILSIPESRRLVSQDQLKHVAEMVSPPQKARSNALSAVPDLKAYLEQFNFTIVHETQQPYGTVYRLDRCPWNPQHERAYAIQFQDGGQTVRCWFDSCKGHGWSHFRDQYEPGWNNFKQFGPPAQAVTPTDTEVLKRALVTLESSHLGHAECVKLMYPDQIAWTEGRGWMTWDGNSWQPNEAMVMQMIASTMRARAMQAAIVQNNQLVLKCATNWPAMSSTQQALRGLVSYGLSDGPSDILNVMNGELNLATGELLPADPTHHSHALATIAYDPGADQSLWLNFLEQTFEGHPETVEYLQQACGYILSGKAHLECLFYFWGPTRAGKGTFTSVLQAILGQQYCGTLDISALLADRQSNNQNFQLAPLVDARLVLSHESSQTHTFNEAKLKTLTGADAIQASFKFKAPFSFTPHFKVLITSNYKPIFPVEDTAMWARLILIEFPHSFVDQMDWRVKANLLQPLALQGALAWMVEGAMKLAANGWSLPVPSFVRVLVEEQRAELDDIGQFLDAVCEQSAPHDESISVTTIELWKYYSAWCVSTDHDALKRKQFAREINRRGYTSRVRNIKGSSVRVYYGLSIPDDRVAEYKAVMRQIELENTFGFND